MIVLDDGETLVDGETRMELEMLEETRTLVQDGEAGRSSVKAVSLYEEEEEEDRQEEGEMVLELDMRLWQ
jgi:hypothetical protein